jgi:DNA repair exonuclease SbcCD ATPase subunit
MRIQQLTIKDIGVFSGIRRFDFDQHITVIYGKNFSGKSTLMRAIYFALCGKILTAGIKTKDIVSDGAKSGTVGITYTVHDILFRIYRSTKGDIQEEQFKDQIWHPAKSAVLPPLNFHQWQVGYFLKEEELGEFLSLTSANRRDLLHQLLGVENLMAARNIFIDYRRFAKNAEKSAIAKRNALGSGVLPDYRDELNEKLSQIKAIEEKIQNIKDYTENYRLVVELEKTKSALTMKQQTVREKITNTLSDFNSVQELNKVLKELSYRLAVRDEHLNQISIQQGKRNTLINQLKNEEDVMMSINKMQNDPFCPTCRQTVSSDQRNKLVADIEIRKQKLRNEIQEAETKEKELTKALLLLNQLAERYADLKERSIHLQHLNDELAEIEQQLAELSTKTDHTLVHASSKELLELKQTFDEQKASLKTLETNHALLERRRVEIQKADYEIHATSHNRLFSEWITDALDMTLKSTMGMPLRQIEKEIYNCLKNFGLLQAKDVSLNLEKAQLLPDLENRSFHALSGGEKSILYLLLKVGVSHFMKGADFLIVDNPSMYLDDLRRENLRDYFLSLSTERQIILFTNDLNLANLITSGKRIDL